MSGFFDVVVTGALNLESIDDSPFVVGGGGVNAAMAASRFATTKLIGCIGTDINSDLIHDLAVRMGLACNGIDVVNGNTFVYSTSKIANKSFEGCKQ